VTLTEQLATLTPTLLARLEARGFEPQRLLAWSKTIGLDRDRRNRLAGNVEPPAAGDVADAPGEGTTEHDRFAASGLELLRRGQVALCVLAGGMATRMGGVVKALVEAIPGRTFLDLRLAEREQLRALAGREPPLWLMTSEATEGPIRSALGARVGPTLSTFEQFVSLRLTPEGALFLDERGQPSAYATGHGDLPDALRASGHLRAFIERGGRLVCIANLDNLGATIDPAILGWHLDHGSALTVEVVDKVGSDRGGVPVRWNGRRIVAEEFRLPLGFDATGVGVFNTNTFVVSAEALASLAMQWTYVEVEKTINQRKAVQFERLLGEMSAALEPRFLRVPRAGIASRFLPVKDAAELERRRPEIDSIARARIGC
jgi:UTP--glucose-1-phosphate uridylyltransferase